MLLALVIASLLGIANIPHQFPVLGRGIPMATSGGGSTTDITASDVTLVGYYALPLTDDNGKAIGYAFPGLGRQGFALEKVAGVNHFFVMTSHNATSQGAPVEITEPGVYNSSGVCTSGTCPGSTLATAVRISTANVIAAWGVNGDGTVNDIYGGNLQNLWNIASGTMSTSCTAAGGACEPGLLTVTPNGDFLITYGPNYGGVALINVEANGSTAASGALTGAFLVHPIAAHTGGGVARSTSVTGPYVFKDAPATAPPATDYPDKGWAGTGFAARYLGIASAGYFVHMPDGSIGWGSGDSEDTQQGGAPNGLSLQVASAAMWPTPSTTSSATARIVASQNWLHTYNLNGYYPTTGGALTTANWSFKPPESYPYVYEGNGSGCNNGACFEIDPLANSGQGSWQENAANGGMVCINTATKQGCIAIMTTATNHSAGNVVDCLTHGNGKTAHNWYNGGGSFPNCPLHSCAPLGSNTGPQSTAVEDRWEFYKWSDLQAVNGGTKTDYTVQPISTLFSADTFSLPTTGSTEHGITVGTSQTAFATAGGYDPDTNLLYVLFRNMDNANSNASPIIGVFHITQ